MLFKNLHCRDLRVAEWHIKPKECWAVLARGGASRRQLGRLASGELDTFTGEFHNSFKRPALLSFEAELAFYEQELKRDDTDFMDHPDPGTRVSELLGLGAEEIPPELAFLNLDKILGRGYRQLSSGESRKVLLARALLDKPDLLVLDEPYDSLDTASRGELVRFFQVLAAQGGMQLLFLLGSVQEVAPWHTHVAVMVKGELVAQGPRETLLRDPAALSLLRFNPSSLPPWPETLYAGPLPDPLVELKNGRVRYGETVIFDGINLTVRTGEHTLLTGPNGAGKSTLLNLITGDHSQCYGNDLQVMGFRRGTGESIWQVKKRIGLVSPGLHRDHRAPGSALHIVLGGFFDSIGLYDDPSAEQIRHARQWLELTGLKESAQTPFKHLSYGEQRLTLIARALVKQPALLILDEPTQGLDDVNRHRVMYFLEHLSSQRRTTIIMASHRLDEHLPLFVRHLHLGEPETHPSRHQ